MTDTTATSSAAESTARSSGHMDYHALEHLRQKHPGWRLLTADHAALVVSFLHRTFVVPNIRTLPQGEIVAKLDDHLHHIRQSVGLEAFPRTAQQYVDDWSDHERGWLRKHLIENSDEPYFDLTSAAQGAIVWLARLGQRQFVGTESRLLTVLGLLRQIVEGSESDPGVRIAELQRRRDELDAEIERLRAGGRVEVLDAAQVRDRFQQMDETAHAILSDFGEVEQNLRDLDRRMRERIATWDGGKGALVAEMFVERDAIGDSDTGRSFRAFWDFLMAPARQDELTALLAKVFKLEAIRALKPDRRITRIHYEWLKAGDSTQRTVARLSEQLRRFLDDQAFLESRRIVELVRAVEQLALGVRTSPPTSPSFTQLDDVGPSLHLPMERPLFTRPEKPRIEDVPLEEGDEDIDAAALFEQVYVDKGRLRAHIRHALQLRPEVTLEQIIDEHPLEQGLAELVAYLSLATDDERAIIDDTSTKRFSWIDVRGRGRCATLPAVTFHR